MAKKSAQLSKPLHTLESPSLELYLGDCREQLAAIAPSYANKVDLIFADPPYQKSPDDRAWNRELLGSPQLPKLLAPEGWLILESWSQASEPAVPSPWICQDDRTYGAARVRFFQLQTSAPHE